MATSILNQDFGSDSEEEDFNPAPVETSDNEADGDAASDEDRPAHPKSPANELPRRSIPHDDHDDEDELEEGAGKSKPKERPQSSSLKDDEDDEGERIDTASGVQNGDEDEEEEDEEDDDDEEAVSGRPRKRRRKGGMGQFFEEEAEVDEDEDQDDEDDEGAYDGFVADTHPDDLAALPAGAETDDRRHRELDRRRELEASMDAEKQAQALKERYGRNRAAATDSVVVPKRLLLPSVDDPSIWGVKCRPGKEREVVYMLIKRFEERGATKDPLPIISAFERGGTMTGYVYVEARKQSHVLNALSDIPNAYPRSKMVLVPVKEMPDLLRVTKTEELMPGGWVRIKRGKYQGDLAQLEEVETNGLDVTVRLVPRLDYGLNEDAKAPMIDNGVKGNLAKRKRQMAQGLNNPASRPPQRLFNENEAKKKHGRHLTATSGLGGKAWNYMNDTYIDGFLIKDMKIQHLLTQNVNPQLDEVTKFARGAQDGTENLDLAALAASLKNNTAEDSYLPGDTVEVYDGEQQGVTGRTVSVRGDIISLKVTEGELAGQTIDVPMKGLRKLFKEGDHVQIIGGSRFRDELGMVVRIKDDRVTVLSDMSMQEITVFSKDLREAADSGVDGILGKYDVHDLVQLDPATVACVIKVDRESMLVLDQNGSVRSILPSQVTNKIEPRRDAVATDRNGSEIRHGDTVREVAGDQKNGVILHIYRSFLFLHNRVQTENSGLIVARATNVATVAAKGGRVAGGSAGPDLTKMNPALQRNGMNGNGAMAPPKTFGRDRTLGKTVTIRKGPYKGLLGIVKDTTDTQARVELHSKSKTITVDKDTLSIKDPLTGQSMDFSRFGGRGPTSANRTGFGGATTSRTPGDWQGGRTPVAGADSARTPAWGASSRTPAWTGGTATGSRTPAWKASDGSRTAYGGATSYGGSTAFGAGGRTPAWNSGTRTPYDANAGFGNATSSSSSAFDAFAAGSKTPVYNSNTGSRTPAWGTTIASAPTPSANGSNSNFNPGRDSSHKYDAPTPGADLSLSAPTPAAYNSAPTPAASAPTPRGYGSSGGIGGPDAAPTPRAWPADNAPTPAATGANAGPLGQKRVGAYDAPTPAFSGARGMPYDAPTPSMDAANAPTPGVGGGYGGGGAGGGIGVDDGGPRYEEDSD